MTEKVELKVNSKNLSSVISLLKKKYMIIGGSWTGKSEPIALKLAKFCIRVDDNPEQKIDIISLLLKYDEDDLNRKHAFIGISAADLLILLFNEEMKLSINNNRLTTKYYEKTLNTTRNLHGLLLEDISLNSQDKLHVEVSMTVDIRSCKKVSFKDNSSDYIIQQLSSGSVNQEDNPSDDIIQQLSSGSVNQEDNSSDDIIQQLSSGSVNQEDNSSDDIIQQLSSGSVNQEDNSSDNVIEQTGSSDDIIQKSNSIDNIIDQTSSNNTAIQQEDDPKNVVINNKLVNGIMISIVATFIVLLKLKII